jgi:hypothetical protein
LAGFTWRQKLIRLWCADRPERKLVKSELDEAKVLRALQLLVAHTTEKVHRLQKVRKRLR